jgi:putative endonuclease
MFCVYILYSLKHQKSYTGMTSDLITRFQFHNHKSTKGYTKRYRPWYCIHVEFFDTKSSALKREKELESSKGREWIIHKILPLYV